MIKISNTFIFLIICYVLGYTEFVGGPFDLAKFLFIATLVVSIIFSIFTWRIKSIAKKETIKSSKKETIKVDVKVID